MGVLDKIDWFGHASFLLRSQSKNVYFIDPFDLKTKPKEEAEEVFFNKPLKIFRDKKHSADETRFVAYGINSSNRKLTLVFTIRKQKIRIISARDQSKKERRVYEA